MKNIVIYFCLLACIGCSSNKEVNTILKSESTNRQSIVVIEDKIGVFQTLQTLKGMIISNATSTRRTGTKMVSEDELKFLFEKYRADTIKESWQTTDFPKVKFRLVKNDLRELDKQSNDSTAVYMLSKPLFTKNRQNAVLYFYKSVNHVTKKIARSLCSDTKITGK